jgi:LuxR family quorum-sensing transcriptional regulator LasR
MNVDTLSVACLTAFEACEDEADAKTRLTEICRLLNVDGFLYWTGAAEDTAKASEITISSYDETWHRVYAENDFRAIDPTVAHAITGIGPLLWDDVLYAGEGPLALRAAARRHGMDCGVTIPIHAPDGGLGSLSAFVDSRRVSVPTARQHLLSVLPHLCLLSVQLHQFVTRSVKAPAAPTVYLTKRERECLRWIAAGKSTWEIGCILNISEHGVTHHIRNVMRKFDCTSRHVAAARALAQKLI